MNDLTILGALQDIAKDITEPQPRLIIYNDIVGLPHTFIGLLDEAGNEILRGFAPEATALKGKGKIFNENGHEYSSKIVISISKEQYQKALDFIEKSETNPPFYDLPNGVQCSVWAIELTNHIGATDIKMNLDNKGFSQTWDINPYDLHFYGLRDILKHEKNRLEMTY